MNFFKSVFSDDPEEPSNPEMSATGTAAAGSDSPPVDPKPSPSTSDSNSMHSIASVANAWSFGGLVKTLASRSESVIETYRRDLEEFGSGLRKETAVIREVASRAVRELPTTLEAGAAAAQGSLETVGQAIDNIGSSVTEIISHGKDSIVDGDSDYESSDSKQISGSQSNLSLNSRTYSRTDAQIRALQCDRNTYCNEPEDVDEYSEWKLRFKLDEMSEEIENLMEENASVEEIYNEVVPRKIDQETFWTRYFYRAYKLKKAEEARARLVKRAISGEDEVLSWDVDDDDYEVSDVSNSKGESRGPIQEKDTAAQVIENPKVESEEKSTSRIQVDHEGIASESRIRTGIEEGAHSDGSETSSNKLERKPDEKLGSEGKDSDFSVVSSQPSAPEEEDLSWDEIEDIGGADDIKVAASGSPNKVDLPKRLSAMEEDEDLSWDIEDDDEPDWESHPTEFREYQRKISEINAIIPKALWNSIVDLSDDVPWEEYPPEYVAKCDADIQFYNQSQQAASSHQASSSSDHRHQFPPDESFQIPLIRRCSKHPPPVKDPFMDFYEFGECRADYACHIEPWWKQMGLPHNPADLDNTDSDSE